MDHAARWKKLQEMGDQPADFGWMTKLHHNGMFFLFVLGSQKNKENFMILSPSLVSWTRCFPRITLGKNWLQFKKILKLKKSEDLFLLSVFTTTTAATGNSSF